MRPFILLQVAIGLLALASCSQASAPQSTSDQKMDYEEAKPNDMAYPVVAPAPEAPSAATSPAKSAARAEGGGAKEMDGLVGGIADNVAKDEPGRDRGGNSDDAESEGSERMRSWFPEAFLWQPLVETDATGTAVVPVKVPDQLTTWRILALAHSRTGSQAGTVYTFDSSLPTYVDPVVPGWLFAGDRLDLPVQVVNTTNSAVTTQLSVSSNGSLSGSAVANISLPAGGSTLRSVALIANGAGASEVTAILDGSDAAKRVIPVIPRGRPVAAVRGGTLSSESTFSLASPAEADRTTQALSVLVFPGPLSLLQAEVDRGTGSTSASDAAYGFAVAAHMHDLARKTHTEVDEKALRRLSIVSWQRVVSYGQAPDAGTAADLLAALRYTTDHDQAKELTTRLARTLSDGQRADGTWARQDTGSLQQVLVQTAFAGRTLPETATAARTKASAALSRQQAQIKDPYTAAVVLASGLAEPANAAKLHQLVIDSLVDAADGHKSISTPENVLNAWGWRPSRPEILAWTVLALNDPTDATVRGDLVSELMAGYDASGGFGAGPADIVALDAVSAALPGLDQPVDVVLLIDGVEVDRAKLDPAQPKLPALLETKGTGKVTLRAEPAVPGLAFVATQHSWVPWTGDENLPGVEVSVSSSDMTVGEDGVLTLTFVSPSGTSLIVEQGLPAGAAVDEEALAGLYDRLESWTVHSDRIEFTTLPMGAGVILEVPLVVRPAFAGSFSTVPLTVEARGDGRKIDIAPVRWDVGS